MGPAARLVDAGPLAGQDHGEVCRFAIDADVGAPPARYARVRVGTHQEPRLVSEVAEVEVPVVGPLSRTWTARWDDRGVVLASTQGWSPPRRRSSRPRYCRWSASPS